MIRKKNIFVGRLVDLYFIFMQTLRQKLMYPTQYNATLRVMLGLYNVMKMRTVLERLRRVG